MVFYRKYRPQTISELDSEEVRNTLSLVLSKARDSVPHAFLFSGAKGLGKTSAARIVAKVVNCEKLASSSVEPCNKCSQCVSITNGTNLDVLEIDGASNRGIDEIRDLREKIRLLPATAAKKVYIIDEVHMLTIDAFNALLKTLEEPPAHAMFILCTTEPQKIPATILSRCFHILFKRALEDELLRSFKRIAQKEKLKIDEDAFLHIASLSDGSFRDGVKILEELAVLGRGEKITKELVEEKYQIRQLADQISQMLKFLFEKDTKRALRLVSKLMEQGVDMKYFLEQMIGELHTMLLVEVGVEDARGPVATPRFNIEEIKELISLLTRAYGELKYAVLPQLPLEIAIIEWGIEKKDNTEESAGRLPHVANDARQALPKKSSQPLSLSERRLRKDDSSSDVKSKSAFSSFASGQAPSAIWQELIAKIKPYNHSVAGVLRSCSIKSFDGGELVIETNYKFHKERLEERKIKELLEKIAEEIIGDKIIISVVLQKN